MSLKETYELGMFQETEKPEFQQTGKHQQLYA